MPSNPLRIVCSMLTNQIYATRVNEDKNIMVGNKTDVTDSAPAAVGMHLWKSQQDVLFEADGKKLRLTVVEEQ